jgi:hypothetical protein
VAWGFNIITFAGEKVDGILLQVLAFQEFAELLNHNMLSGTELDADVLGEGFGVFI